MNNTRLRQTIITSVLAIAALTLGAANAEATHFRYGSISWSIPNPSTAPRTVQVRFDAAWRWSFAWYRVVTPTSFSPYARPPVGMVVTGDATDPQVAGPSGEYAFRVMQGNTVVATFPLHMTVTGIDNVADIMTTSFTITYTLPAPGNFRFEFNECCRLSTLVGPNADDESIVTAGITVSNSPPANQQPVAATLPIMNVLYNQPAATFTVPAYDPDGDPLTFSLPTTPESGLSQPAPNGLSINPTTGVVTWNTTSATGTVLNGLYAVQVRVADNKGAYTVVDLLLRPVQAVGQPPIVRINGQAANAVFNVVRNTPMTFSVLGTDPEGAPVTLTSSPRPPGSAMTPSLPTTASGNVSSTFTWTPAPTDVGTYVITYSAIDGNGLQGTRSATINVTNNPPTLSCTASGGAIEATGPLGALFSVSADIDDADGDLLSRTVLIDGVPMQTSSGLNPGTTVPYTTPTPVALGNHTYEVRVSDSLGAPVSCTGAFSIVDTTAPSLSLPAGIVVEASAPAGAVVTFTASAIDVVDTTPTVSCTPSSGSTFPIGTTMVECTATDAALNSTTGTFNVTVNPAATSLSPLSISPNTLVGSLIEVTSTLTRSSSPGVELAGAPIRWVLTGPGPSDSLVQGSMTNPGGMAYLPFTPTQRGVYSLTAYFDGGGELAPSQSATTTFTVYQRTQLFIYASVGTAGDQIIERAELVAMPQGTPLPGTVTFSYTGPSAIAPVDVVADGVFFAPTTFPLPGTYTLTAAFSDGADLMTDAAGTIPPAPTMTTAEIPISPVFTVMSDISVFNNTNTVGAHLTVMAGLDRSSAPVRPLEGREVVFTMTSPGGSVTATALTAPNGTAIVEFTLAERGPHTITASYAGDEATMGSASSPQSFPVYQPVRLTVAPAAGIAGGDTPLAATLMLVPQGTPLGSQPVQFSTTGMPGLLTGTTDSLGNAGVTAVFPVSGSYNVQAQFDGFADYYVSAGGAWGQPEIASNIATISAAASAVAVAAPSNALVQGPLAVSATLTRTAAPAGPVGSAPVVFRLTSPSSTVTELWAETDASGTAVVTFTPAERGVHTVTAGFGGDAALDASTSAPSSISVYQRAQLALAPATGGTSALPVVATLTAVPQNSPLSNQPVQFSFDGVVPSQSASTDASGAATVMVAFPSIGTFASHAVVFNPADFLTDAAGTMPPAPSTASSTITITDATPPVITPTLTGTLGANGSYTSDVTVSWTVTDPETAITSLAGCATTTTTTDGSFSFTCTAVSGGGTNSASVSFQRDATAPVIGTATPSQGSLWPPDHRMVPVTISVPATDNSGAPVCSITSISSNEPQNGLGDGDTPNDWLITGPLTAQVRAERAGKGNGRLYTFSVRCVDAAGNAATSSTAVNVPKSQKK